MDSNIVLDIVLIVLAVLNIVTGNISMWWLLCLIAVIIISAYDLIKRKMKKRP